MATGPLRTRLSFARHHARATLLDRGRDHGPAGSAPYRPAPGGWPDDRATFAWLGHATVLGNFYGTWLLTDPALETRIGVGRGMAKLGPRRLVAPALGPRELPPIDLLLLSHA